MLGYLVASRMAIFNFISCFVQHHPNASFYPPYRTVSLWFLALIKARCSGKQFFRTIKQLSEHMLDLIWGVVQDVFGKPHVRVEKKADVVEFAWCCGECFFITLVRN